MKPPPTIGVFADALAQRDYLAALVRLAGAEPVFEAGADTIVLSLCIERATAPGGVPTIAIDSPRRAASVIAALEQALLRHAARPPHIRIGDAMLDTKDNLWMAPAFPESVRLTDKETDILFYLFDAGGQPVSRDDLLRHVWGYAPDAQTHTLETHIYRLRQKIEPEPSAPRYLLTFEDGYAVANAF